MKELKIYQVDAFTDKVFSGNPAAICPLENWLDDETMLKIAGENNLSETAFYVKRGNRVEIRWFTPTVEVDLCGHATLASAFVLFHLENYNADEIEFYSPRSGTLTVKRVDDWLTLNFPVDQYTEVDLTEELTSGFNFKPLKAFKGKTDYLLVFENEEQIRDIKVDFTEITKIKARGIIITAKGNESDFVSRFFAPQVGINEDPVCGSAHTFLTPFWSEVLHKNELSAIQLSDRKGYLKCKNLNDRVELSGQARLYLKGTIEIE